MKIAVLLASAGSGERLATKHYPKPYTKVCNKALISHCIDKFRSLPMIDLIQPVIRKGHENFYKQCIQEDIAMDLKSNTKVLNKVLPYVFGSTFRQGSVLQGLQALSQHKIDFVIVHDACRPIISTSTIEEGLKLLQENPDSAVVPTLTINDSIYEQNLPQYKAISSQNFKRILAPQFFSFRNLYNLIREEKNKNLDSGLLAKDEASLFEKVITFQGNYRNIKVTYQHDLKICQEMLQQNHKIKTTQGIDFHQLKEGRDCILGGIKIPHIKGPEGHSDGDAILHSLTDAILAQCTNKDIGELFPSCDKRWEGKNSSHFLSHALNLLKEKNYNIISADITIICQEPKLSPHKNSILENISRLLEIAPEKISVKATTTDYMGFLGRCEGIGVFSIVTCSTPADSGAGDMGVER